MGIRYVLSNRQRKELLVRGRTISIALPVPPVEIDDAADWARSVLPAEIRGHVATASEVEIEVAPQPRTSEAKTLDVLLGTIVPPGNPGRLWVVRMAVVIVKFRPCGAQRHVPAPRQWPANVMIDGVPFLSSRDTTGDSTGD